MLVVITFVVLLAVFQSNNVVNCESEDSAPKITLPHGGILVGSYMKSAEGKQIRAFRGIPYAKPPLGDLRFRRPQPAEPWTGEKLANSDPTSCLSIDTFERDFRTLGDEDCLYLNVYAPAEKTSLKPFSVMVWLFGGGWLSGNGNSDLYGPQLLLDHNVILVSGNYRLGVLGFLSTGTRDCPGNNGLKDQLMMLKWVKENIVVFGGNPNDVTIFGQSAGGGSVGLQMFSYLSKGYFHKAVLQSGTNFDIWAVGEKSVVLGRTEKIGKLVNCSKIGENWKPLIDCLRTRSAVDVASTIKKLFKYDIDPAVVLPAVVEPPSEEAFLTKHPRDYDILPSAAVPVIIGILSGDGIVKSGPLLNLKEEDFTEKFSEAVPIILYYDNKPNDIQYEITGRIDDFYFKRVHNWSKKNSFNLTNLFTDGWFAWGMDKFLRNRFATSKKTKVGATYAYLFDHRGPISMSVFFKAGPEYYGVCHTDELPYLFRYKSLDIQGNKNDTKMKWAMPYMWTNFAKTGNPTPEISIIPKWIPAEKFPLNYAHIGRRTAQDWTILSNEIGLLEERVQFWRNMEHLFDG